MFEILMNASIYCIKQEYDQCVHWLSKAVEMGEMDYQWYLMDPIYSSATQNPSIQLLME